MGLPKTLLKFIVILGNKPGMSKCTRLLRTDEETSVVFNERRSDGFTVGHRKKEKFVRSDKRRNPRSITGWML